MSDANALHPNARFVVGIDLGTTNCALSYADLEAAQPHIESFAVPQLVAAGQLHSQPLLPSFLYLTQEHEADSSGGAALPWPGAPVHVSVGLHARRHGALNVDRLVASAKSYLPHKALDPRSPTLPWGSTMDPSKRLSPLQATTTLLSHLRLAWNHAYAQIKSANGTPALLEEQIVVITVPASFDELARELTLEAAGLAGLRHFTLQEEPLAAFYAWLHQHRDSQQLIPGDRVLIIDVGGGTTDFSLVEVHADPAGATTLRRSCVGPHLLLGGDNLDRAIAHFAQTALKRSLAPREMSALIHEARRVKEELLGSQPPEKSSLTIAGSGSSLMKGLQSVPITRAELESLALDGFFPPVGLDDPEPERKTGLRDLGLPYERDCAVSRHLLGFLRKDQKIFSRPALAVPNKVLFNGGSMHPAVFRQALMNNLRSWAGPSQAVEELPVADLDLAVAHGACAYGLARCERGVRIQGGILRSYYLEIAGASPEAARQWLCLIPRDCPESQPCPQTATFRVRTNQAVSFPLLSSDTRLQDQPGDILPSDTPDISPLAPLLTTLAFGGGKSQEITVRLHSLLNESGALEVWIESTSTPHRWRLGFDLRALHDNSQDAEPCTQSRTLPEEALLQARLLIRKAFADPDQEAVKSLNRQLEEILELPRQQWSLELCRRLHDSLLELPMQDLRRSAQHESRFFNLAGFTLRPGFGDSADPLRMKKLWPLSHSGPAFARDPQVAAEFFILWRRTAAAISRGQQEQMSHSLIKELPHARGNILREMWRTLGALEFIPARLRQRLLQDLAALNLKTDQSALWVLARLAARRLVYASADRTMPASEATPLLMKLLQIATPEERQQRQQLIYAIRSIASFTGDPHLDLPQELREQVAEALRRLQASEHDIAHVLRFVEEDDADASLILGDSLPVGLTLHQA